MTTRDYLPEARHATVTPGEMVRIIRELQGLSQTALSRASGISQSAISAIESGAMELGLKRARVLADALDVPPAAIAFPDWRPSPRPPARVNRSEPARLGAKARAAPRAKKARRAVTA